MERAECVERIEREGEGERTGTGGMFEKALGAEETGADLVVWRGGRNVGEEGVVSSGSEEVENGMEDKRSKNEGESLPSNNFFLSASAMFLVARLASNFSVRNFSYNTSFVLTFNIYKPTYQIRIRGKGGFGTPSYALTERQSSTPQSHNGQGSGHQSSPTGTSSRTHLSGQKVVRPGTEGLTVHIRPLVETCPHRTPTRNFPFRG